MGITTHRFRVHEARRTTHPAFSNIEKHTFTVPARDFPRGISTKANARDPVGLNRRVYRDVMDSLLGSSAIPGTFDLMNKGITILAQSVRLIDKDAKLYDVDIDDDLGIVDGAHTAKIIEEAQANGEIPLEQHVDVYIRTNVENGIVSDIAKGLNTGMQVKAQSIFNIDGVFDWLKDEIKGQPFEPLISWKESDEGEYDVRDLIGVLELFNVLDFPNNSARHPISAYEKWSIPLDKFGADYRDNFKGKGPKASTYYRLRGLLLDGLKLHDIIRRDFRIMHNAAGGSAGNLKILEEASARRKEFQFPFAQLKSEKYRLTKGALYPMLGAFRNCVELNPRTGEARWADGFEAVLEIWKEDGPELVRETVQATRDIGRLPDQLGKNRSHWANMHKTLELRVLRRQMKKDR